MARREPEPLDRVVERLINGDDHSRRVFLKRMGAVGLVAGAGTVLSACGGIAGERTSTVSASAAEGQIARHAREKIGTLTVSNWPLYIDKKTPKQWQAKYDADLKYIEDINDNEEFFAKVRQELQDGPPIHGNTRLEVIWTALPATLIAGLVVYAYLVLHDIEKAPANPATEMHVTVVGQQFAWHFEYPQPGGKPVRSDQLYVPEGRSVHFDVKSEDVLHDFWVPAWRMKIDAVPGITHVSWQHGPSRMLASSSSGVGTGYSAQENGTDDDTPESERTVTLH